MKIPKLPSLFSLFLFFLNQTLFAQDATLDTALREEVLMVKKSGGIFNFELETTFYRPPGSGPFPIVVINHGKAAGEPRYQARWRHSGIAREFVSRGYMVAMPMRQGFSKSSGSYIGGGCNVESNGRVQSEDVVAIIEYLKTRQDADTQKIIVAGQSHGGLTTMAFGALNYPGVLGLINFAGGLRQDSCTGWENNLTRAFGSYGKESKLPSLWFYGDNDSYWQPWLFKDMHQRYVEGGGKAKLIAYGVFGQDAHGMFGNREGFPIWVPEVEKFLVELNLPIKKISLSLQKHAGAIPPTTSFAKIGDEKALPFVNDNARKGYLRYLSEASPKAFAIAPTGNWAYFTDRSNAIQSAIDRCNQNAKSEVCKLYAVDDEVVWQP